MVLVWSSGVLDANGEMCSGCMELFLFPIREHFHFRRSFSNFYKVNESAERPLAGPTLTSIVEEPCFLMSCAIMLIVDTTVLILEYKDSNLDSPNFGKIYCLRSSFLAMHIC